jgi:hypothetical protein
VTREALFFVLCFCTRCFHASRNLYDSLLINQPELQNLHPPNECPMKLVSYYQFSSLVPTAWCAQLNIGMGLFVQVSECMHVHKDVCMRTCEFPCSFGPPIGKSWSYLPLTLWCSVPDATVVLSACSVHAQMAELDRPSLMP